MKYSLVLPEFDEMKGDCGSCQALCCMAHRHAPSANFPIPKDKPGGLPCIHLSYESGFECGIYTERAEKGFSICSHYDCFGAGQMITSFFTENFDFLWSSDPKLLTPSDQLLITINMRFSYNVTKFVLGVFDSRYTMLRTLDTDRASRLLDITNKYLHLISQVLYVSTLSGNEFDPNGFANLYKADADKIFDSF